ncbi:hypothetical protein EYF80_058488 [Liparis tanakae]|uniref:Uncharacterized protein n=1 Tax=Liparis tanakae TaxID=230148 RepID=A0A4Z2ERX6_9TELE|nr:hypothetical protein EYF80_058488 [Liparis tanakae]
MKKVLQSFLSCVTSRISFVMLRSRPATGGTRRKSKILRDGDPNRGPHVTSVWLYERRLSETLEEQAAKTKSGGGLAKARSQRSEAVRSLQSLFSHMLAVGGRHSFAVTHGLSVLGLSPAEKKRILRG